MPSSSATQSLPSITIRSICLLLCRSFTLNTSIIYLSLTLPFPQSFHSLHSQYSHPLPFNMQSLELVHSSPPQCSLPLLSLLSSSPAIPHQQQSKKVVNSPLFLHLSFPPQRPAAEGVAWMSYNPLTARLLFSFSFYSLFLCSSASRWVCILQAPRSMTQTIPP